MSNKISESLGRGYSPDWLDKITSFNLNARYDDYKREFYSLCSKEFTKEWIDKIKIIRSWIKQKL